MYDDKKKLDQVREDLAALTKHLDELEKLTGTHDYAAKQHAAFLCTVYAGRIDSGLMEIERVNRQRAERQAEINMNDPHRQAAAAGAR